MLLTANTVRKTEHTIMPKRVTVVCCLKTQIANSLTDSTVMWNPVPLARLNLMGTNEKVGESLDEIQFVESNK